MHAYSGHPCTVVALKLSPLLLVRPGELQALTGHGRYVFGTSAKADRPMSENTVNKALQAMGYPGSVQTAHGFCRAPWLAAWPLWHHRRYGLALV